MRFRGPGRDICVRKIRIPAGRRRMPALVLSLRGAVVRATGILWIHGGGYVTGMAGMVHMSRAKALVKNYGAVVVSPEYRLAGQAPYPAALMDCHHALLYLREHAEELGVRPDQIMVGGESAGGGLAAALCMYEKDCGGVEIAYQMPLYPMLDNEDTETSRNNHAPVWNTKRNHYGWSRYLRGLPGGGGPMLRLSCPAAGLCRAASRLHLCVHRRALLCRDPRLCGASAGGRRGGGGGRLPGAVPRL